MVSKKLHCVVFLVSLAAVPGAQAAIPPAAEVKQDAVPPAVAKLVSDGEKATEAGNLPLAVIQFKNASSALPRNARIRAQLGVALLRLGDLYSTERELRQARKDGAPDQIILPPLLQVMLSRHEEKALLEEFPEPVNTTNPGSAAEIYKARALALQTLGQATDAVAAMGKSLEFRRDVPGLITRARIAQQQHDLHTAITFADEAAKLTPLDPNMMLFKFGLLLEQNDLGAAMALSDEMIARFPDSLSARLSRVESLIRTKQTAKARAEANAIAAKNPNNAAAVYYRALTMAASGDAKGAWRTAQILPEQYVQVAPSVVLAVSQMAVQAGAPDTGAAILGAAVRKFPAESSLRLRLAAIRLRQNDTTAAINALEPMRGSLDAATAELLAKLYMKAGKSNDALMLLEKVEQAGKGTDQTTLSIVGLQGLQGQTTEALSHLIQASARKPTDPLLAGQLVAVFIRTGRFSEALATADRLGADPKQRPLVMALRGQIELAQGKMSDALVSYNKVLELEPKSAMGLYGRASVLQLMQRFSDANKDLRALLATRPKDLSVHLKLAEVAAYQGHDEEVRSVLSEAIQQSPQVLAPRFALVRYLLVRKDTKAALAAARELVHIEANNAEAVALLGQVQLLAGQKREAVASFRRLVEIAPRTSTPQLLLGTALFASGDRTGAMAALQTAVKLDPHSVQARTAQINILLAQGKLDDAITSARTFQAGDPTSGADILLGDTLARAGRGDEAAAVYRKSFEARPNDVALMRMVHTEVGRGNHGKALDAMSQWLAKKPQDSSVRAEYATLLMGRGEKDKAAAQYEMVLKEEPNNVLALNNLGWLRQTDDPKRALALLAKAKDLAPDMPDVLDTLAWLKMQQKQAAQSLPLLQRAHSLRPADGQITYHLVLALDANGKRENARETLNALLASKSKFVDIQAAQELAVKWK